MKPSFYRTPMNETLVLIGTELSNMHVEDKAIYLVNQKLTAGVLDEDAFTQVKISSHSL